MKHHRINRTRLIVTTLVLVCVLLTIYNLWALHSIKAEIHALNNENTQEEQVPEEVEKVAVIEQKEPEIAIQLTAKERELVCRVVSAESRGEDLQGQMAVAQVIRDRANSWDMTVTEVVTAPSQFARPYQGEISDETYLAVANVFDGNMSVLDVPTTHFYSGDKEPYWTSDKVNRGKVGNHIFFY